MRLILKSGGCEEDEGEEREGEDEDNGVDDGEEKEPDEARNQK